jgi:hypothetical protein
MWQLNLCEKVPCAVLNCYTWTWISQVAGWSVTLKILWLWSQRLLLTMVPQWKHPTVLQLFFCTSRVFTATLCLHCRVHITRWSIFFFFFFFSNFNLLYPLNYLKLRVCITMVNMLFAYWPLGPMEILWRPPLDPSARGVSGQAGGREFNPTRIDFFTLLTWRGVLCSMG